MYTLATILILLGLFSYYKINKKCKEKGVSFNPVETNFFYYVFFIIGLSVAIVSFIGLCITYLP